MPPIYTKKDGKTKTGTQKYKPDPAKYLYNIDTFWYNCRSYYYQEVMDRGLRDILVDGRSYADDAEKQLSIDLKVDGYEKPIKFTVDGGNKPAYQYSLRNDSMAIYFRKNEHEQGSLMRVQINQFLLWEKGLVKAYEDSLQVLKALGFTPYEKKINRVDFAVHSDQFVWTYEDMKTFQWPQNIARDNFPNYIKLDANTGFFETMYVGDRSRLFMRIYNKSKEIKVKKKDYFLDIYKAHGMDEENIWNTEIEVRRPYLKELADYCPDDDDLKKIYDDIDYAIENDGISKLWTHLVAKYGHNSAHWTQLKKGDPKKFVNINSYNLVIARDIDANYQREVPQITGRLMMGVINKADYSLENAVRIFLENYLGDDPTEKRIDFLNRVEEKKARIMSEEINRSIKTDEMRAQHYFHQLSQDLKEVTKPNVHEQILINEKNAHTSSK